MKQLFAPIAGLLLILTACSEKVKVSPEQEEAFVKYYGNSYLDYGMDVKEVPGRGYAVVGHTTRIIDNVPGSEDILFLLTDKAGNLRQEPMTFGGPMDDEGNSLALASDGGFVIAGTTTDSSTSETDVMIIRLDKNGKEMWKRVHPWPGNQTGNQIKFGSDNSLLIAGESDGRALVLMLEDAEGSGIDSIAQPGSSFAYRIVGLEESASSGIRLAGSFSNGSSSNFSVSFSPDMKVLPSNTEIQEGIIEHAYGHCLAEPDTLLICGSRMVGGIQKGLLKKIALLGGTTVQVTLEKIYGEPGETVTLESVRMLSSGNIALLATRKLAENSDILVYFCDRDGKILNTTLLGDNSAQEAGDMGITSDGGFIITGSNLLDNNSMLSLIKLNAAGKLE